MTDSAFKPILHVIDDNDTMCKAAAEHIVALVEEKWREGDATSSKPRLTIALAGGSTPKAVYQYLARNHPSIVRDGLECFFGDVRMVPDDHKDSNYAMVKASLFTNGDGNSGSAAAAPLVAPEHIHTVDTSLSPAEAARKYEEDIIAFFNKNNSSTDAGGRPIPSFDLVMLGFGPDGHTASLFPHTPAPLERSRLVTDCMPTPNVTPLVSRVTMTVPLIIHSKAVMVLARGAEKQWVLEGVVNGVPSPLAAAQPIGGGSAEGGASLPVAAFLRECAGTGAKVYLYVDKPAAPSS